MGGRSITFEVHLVETKCTTRWKLPIFLPLWNENFVKTKPKKFHFAPWMDTFNKQANCFYMCEADGCRKTVCLSGQLPEASSPTPVYLFLPIDFTAFAIKSPCLHPIQFRLSRRSTYSLVEVAILQDLGGRNGRTEEAGEQAA